MMKSRCQNVLVTGALGHIGSALINDLCANFKLNKLILLDNQQLLGIKFI